MISEVNHKTDSELADEVKNLKTEVNDLKNEVTTLKKSCIILEG